MFNVYLGVRQVWTRLEESKAVEEAKDIVSRLKIENVTPYRSVTVINANTSEIVYAANL